MRTSRAPYRQRWRRACATSANPAARRPASSCRASASQEVERLALRSGIRVRRGRSAFAADHARPGGQPRAVQPGAGNDRHRHRRRRAPRLWRPRPAGGLEPRLLLPPDHLLRGAAADADRAGGDLRPGARDHRLRQRGRGRGDRQRHGLRPGRARAGAGPRLPRAPSRRASAPGRCTSTTRPGAPMRPSAATSARATAANTASKASRNTSRPRPSLATWMARRPLPLEDANAMNTRNAKEQRP